MSKHTTDGETTQETIRTYFERTIISEMSDVF